MSNSKRPSRSDFIKRLLRRGLRLRDPQNDLASIFSTLPLATNSREQVFILARLVAWLRVPASTEDGEASLLASDKTESWVRLRLLSRVLERHPEHRAALSKIILEMIAESDSISLFAQTELTERSGFFSEFVRRATISFLPEAPRPKELSDVAETVFSSERDVEWLERLPEEGWNQIYTLLAWDTELAGPAKNSLLEGLADAVLDLCVYAAAIAVQSETRARLRTGVKKPEGSYEFMALNRAASAWREGGDPKVLFEAFHRCKLALEKAYEGIETSGVSMSLLYRMETLSSLLRRVEMAFSVLIPALAGRDPAQSQRAGRALFIEVVRVQNARRSVKELLRMNFDIFARKLVEHAGETGEHYITKTRAEYWAMFLAASGGGLVMVPITLVKFGLVALGLPLFFEALFVAINYSTGFLSMHFMGFALATKQPAVTAAALADKMREAMSRERMGEFTEEVMRILRSQFIAIVGNVGIAAPAAFALAWLFQATTGKSILSFAYAEKTLANFHPWKSLSIWYASIAGVLLWLSSLCAGWAKNWVSYHRLPEAISSSPRLRLALGDKRCEWIAQWIDENATGIAANVSIGFFLAMMPMIGSIFGLPIDIRHVTLSAAQAAIAAVTLGDALSWELITATVFGIAIIGVMNVAVSTALALIVAARAQQVRMVWLRVLLSATATQFRKTPLRFFFPPQETKSAN